VALVKFAATIVLLIALAAAADWQSPKSLRGPIVFRLQPISRGEKRAFHVEVSFLPMQPTTRVLMPMSWGDAPHLDAQTQNLKVLTSAATLVDTSDAGVKQLHARPGQQVTLAYDIVPQQTEWFRHPQEHMAIINDDYFLFNTENALVYPDLPRTEIVSVTFDWRALPQETQFFSSFGVEQRLIQVRAPWYQVLDALFAGGNFRVTQSHESGTSLVFAARGTWKFTDAEAFAEIRRVIDTENEFWPVQQMPFFLVTLAPFDAQSSDNDGSGFTNAFMLFLSHEDTFDAARVRLLAHEMFHHWNPGSMGPVGDNSLQWFTEGFTVYYEAAIPLRAGLISYADYLEDINRRLQQYQTSPIRRVTNAEWRKMSHSSGPGSQLPYTRGAAIALWADNAIRQQSDGKFSLDNVMFDLVNEAQVPKPPELSSDRVFVAHARYLGPEQASMLRSMALDGAEVPLPQTLGACARLEQVTRAVVDTGFDESSLNTHHIGGVDPDGPAYRAGIREGQKVFRVSIYQDDPSKDVLLGVEIDGKRQMIQYSPAKRLIVSQYQATIDDKATRTCTPF
jgi:predicted metalloprotease with PDZ domain